MLCLCLQVVLLLKVRSHPPRNRFQSPDVTSNCYYFSCGSPDCDTCSWTALYVSYGFKMGYYRRGPYDPESPSLARTHFSLNTAPSGAVFHLDATSMAFIRIA